MNAEGGLVAGRIYACNHDTARRQPTSPNMDAHYLGDAKLLGELRIKEHGAKVIQALVDERIAQRSVQPGCLASTRSG